MPNTSTPLDFATSASLRDATRTLGTSQGKVALYKCPVPHPQLPS
ncbi:hypothetical protein [Nostoc sp.]